MVDSVFMLRYFKLPGAFFLLFASVVPATLVQAQNGSWNRNANGNWSATSNWAGGIIPGAGGTATFGEDFGLSAPRTVTVNVSTAPLSGLIFDSYMGYTLGGGQALNIHAAGFTIDGLKDAGSTPTRWTSGHTISARIAGTSASFTKSGPGKVRLSGINTFIAPIFITGGDLYIDQDTALGNAANSVFIDDAIISFTSNASPAVMNRAITIGQNGATFLSAFGGGEIGSGGSLSGTGQLTIRHGVMTINGNSSGFSGNVKLDNGYLKLGQTGTLSGPGTIDLSGTLELDNSASNADRIANTRTIISRGGTILLTGNNSIGSTENLGTVRLVSGNSQISITSTFTQSTLTLENLVRENRGTVVFRGSRLDDDSFFFWQPCNHFQFAWPADWGRRQSKDFVHGIDTSLGLGRKHLC